MRVGQRFKCQTFVDFQVGTPVSLGFRGEGWSHASAGEKKRRIPLTTLALGLEVGLSAASNKRHHLSIVRFPHPGSLFSMKKAVE